MLAGGDDTQEIGQARTQVEIDRERRELGLGATAP
jgi:hypothetical protein